MGASIYRGDTWQRAWVIQDAAGNPVDLAGATARLHVRDAAGQLVMSASTSDGRLAIAGNRIDLVMPAAVTAAVAPGNYKFGLEVTMSNGVVRTWEQDALKIIEDVTHD